MKKLYYLGVDMFFSKHLERWVVRTFVDTELESVFELNDLLLKCEEDELRDVIFSQSIEEYEHFELLDELNNSSEKIERRTSSSFDNIYNHLIFCCAGEYVAWKRLSVISFFTPSSQKIKKISLDERRHYYILKRKLSYLNKYSYLLFFRYVLLILLQNLSVVINSLVMFVIKVLFLIVYILLGSFSRVRRCMS